MISLVQHDIDQFSRITGIPRDLVILLLFSFDYFTTSQERMHPS